MTDGLFKSESSPYFPFHNVGDSISGPVIRIGQLQGRKYVTPAQRKAGKIGELEFWPDMRPKLTAIVTVQTDMRDPSVPGDDGARSVWIKGKSMETAVKAAVKAAGASKEGIVPGGWFKMTFTHTEEVEGVDQPAKRYEVEYRAPEANGEQEVNVVAPSAPVQEEEPNAGGFDLSSLPKEAQAALQAMMAKGGK